MVNLPLIGGKQTSELLPQEIILFSETWRPSCVLTQLLITWVLFIFGCPSTWLLSHIFSHEQLEADLFQFCFHFRKYEAKNKSWEVMFLFGFGCLSRKLFITIGVAMGSTHFHITWALSVVSHVVSLCMFLQPHHCRCHLFSLLPFPLYEYNYSLSRLI